MPATTRTPSLHADDEKLLRALEEGRLAADAFGHREHVRTAWAMLRLHGLAEGAGRYIRALRRFARLHGASDKYHETITWAFLVAIHERLGAMPPEHSWSDFAAANPDLVADGRGFLGRYYRVETLEGELARRCFVLPDFGIAGAAPVVAAKGGGR